MGYIAAARERDGDSVWLLIIICSHNVRSSRTPDCQCTKYIRNRSPLFPYRLFRTVRRHSRGARAAGSSTALRHVR